QSPYPASDAPGTPRVFDYYGMLLYLERAKLRQPGDEIVLYVATSHGPEPYRIRVSEARRSQRTFEDLSTGETKTVPVRELRLRVSPAKPGQDDEGFMKMEGETEIWVEADTRTLLEIDGEHGGALKVAVSAAPEKGRANRAVERLLAEALDWRVSAVSIVAGEKSRDKVVEIRGLEREEIRRRLSEILGSK